MLSAFNIFTLANLTLLGAFLFFQKGGGKATKVLGFIVFVPATTFLNNYLLYIGILNKYPALHFNLCFLWAPAVLWYVMLVLGEEVKINFRRILVHSLPQIAYMAFYGLLLLQDDVYIQEFLTSVFYARLPWQLILVNFVLYVQIIFYLTYSYRKVISYLNESKRKDDEYSMARVKWVRNFLRLLIALDISAIIVYIVFPESLAEYFVCPLLYNIASYAIIANAFGSSGIFSSSPKFREYSNPVKESKEKYVTSSAQSERLEEYYIKLTECFKNQKPWLNPNISLKELSDQTNIPQHHLSQLINQKMNKNFFDFVNAYRVEEATFKLKAIEQTHLTIEGVGLECGFGSPAAFYRAFKKNTGLTPSQYIKQQKVLEEL